MDSQCVLCEHNPNRRCSVNFAPKYLVNDILKAKCDAPIRIEVIDRATGVPLGEDIPDVHLEVRVCLIADGIVWVLQQDAEQQRVLCSFHMFYVCWLHIHRQRLDRSSCTLIEMALLLLPPLGGCFLLIHPQLTLHYVCTTFMSHAFGVNITCTTQLATPNTWIAAAA